MKMKTLSRKEQDKSNTKFRLIDTGMYGDAAFNALTVLQTHYYFYCFSDKTRRFYKFFNVRRDNDNQVYLLVFKAKRIKDSAGRYLPNPFTGKTKAEVLKFLAKKLKTAALYTAKRNAERHEDDPKNATKWNISNKASIFSPSEFCTFDFTLPFCITMSDIYIVYEKLVGHLVPIDDRVIGRALSEEEIMKNAKAEVAKKTIEKAKNAAKAKMLHEFKQEWQKLIKQKNAICKQKNAIWKKFYKKISDVDPTEDPKILLSLHM